MRRELIIGAFVLSLLASGQAWAQAVIEFAPEQRVKIKEYVVRQKIHPVVINQPLGLGVTLPGDVDLVAVPSDWGPSLTSYRYVYAGNRVLLVDPTTRRVVQIID